MTARTWVPNESYTNEPKLILEAAQRGEAWAQNWVGVQYLFGRDVPKDSVNAAEWIRKAAEQGDRNAQANLGQFYWEGIGVPRDEAEAERWLLMAAEHGQDEAQMLIGFFRAKAGSFKEAACWYRRSAAQGQEDAQNNLGNLFWEGKGVPQDYVEAYKWVNLAASQNVDSAIKGREIIAKKMTRDQIAEAQRQSAAFVANSENDLAEQTASNPQSQFLRMKKDITEQLQRLETFEERMGVRLEALYAEFHENENGYWLTVNGELHQRQGAQLSQNLRVVVDTSDSSGRLICTESAPFLSEEFFGFESFSIILRPPTSELAKIRVYPKSL